MNVEKRSACKDLKTSIIQDIVEQGGDITTGYFPGSLTEESKPIQFVKYGNVFVRREKLVLSGVMGLASICKKKILNF